MAKQRLHVTQNILHKHKKYWDIDCVPAHICYYLTESVVIEASLCLREAGKASTYVDHGSLFTAEVILVSCDFGRLFQEWPETLQQI